MTTNTGTSIRSKPILFEVISESSFRDQNLNTRSFVIERNSKFVTTSADIRYNILEDRNKGTMQILTSHLEELPNKELQWVSNPINKVQDLPVELLRFILTL